MNKENFYLLYKFIFDCKCFSMKICGILNAMKLMGSYKTFMAFQNFSCHLKTFIELRFCIHVIMGFYAILGPLCWVILYATVNIFAVFCYLLLAVNYLLLARDLLCFLVCKEVLGLHYVTKKVYFCQFSFSTKVFFKRNCEGSQNMIVINL